MKNKRTFSIFEISKMAQEELERQGKTVEDVRRELKKYRRKEKRKK